MTTAVLTPKNVGSTQQLSGTVFRKQVLPKGTITYKGRTVKFDDTYLDGLVDSFQKGAFDQVAFQLADKDNAHTNDPERTRGEVIGLEKTGDGLDMIVKLSNEGAALISRNPKLGVSARIFNGLERSDGATFPCAIQHVLGTLDPVVVGLKPWESIELSGQVEETWDFSSQAYPEPAPVEETDEEDETEDETVDEQQLALTALARTQAEREVLDLSTQQRQRELSELTAQAARIRALELELSRSRFDNEAAQLVGRGVPPVLIELARPILELPESNVIELANGSSVDPAGVIRQILKQCEGTIELSMERGHSIDVDDTEKAREDALLAAWKI